MTNKKFDEFSDLEQDETAEKIAADADDTDDTDAKEPNPSGPLDPGLCLSRVLLPADFGRWHTESARRFASPHFYRDAKR